MKFVFSSLIRMKSHSKEMWKKCGISEPNSTSHMNNDNNNNTNKISISHNKDKLHAEFYYTFSSSLFALNLFGNFRFFLLCPVLS